MGLLIRALAIAGQAAIGWVSGDIFNTYQQTKQDEAQASTFGDTVQKVAKVRWWVWLLIGGATFVVTWLFLVLRKQFTK